MVAGRLTEEDLSTSLSEVLERARTGEEFAIERDGVVIAAIVPPQEERSMTLGEFFGTYFDRPRPDDRFADDLEAIQAEQQMLTDVPEWRD